jgi:hypothetical protein
VRGIVILMYSHSGYNSIMCDELNIPSLPIY